MITTNNVHELLSIPAMSKACSLPNLNEGNIFSNNNNNNDCNNDSTYNNNNALDIKNNGGFQSGKSKSRDFNGKVE
eukprot:Awhi_evm1s8342